MRASLTDSLRHTVIPAVPVPFDSRGRLAEDLQDTYVRWMARQDVGGVAAWAHTGRGLLLTDEQREVTLRAWRTGMPDRPIICGVGVPRSTRLPAAPARRTDAVIAATVRLAEAARNGGAAAVMVHPPSALRGLKNLERRVVELHAAVAEAGLPVMAFYLYEAAGGISYSLDAVRELLDLPAVIAIKLATLDSVMTFQALAGVVLAQPRVLLVTGEDRFLGYSLMLGAHAALIGMAAACTDAMVALLHAWFSGRHADFVAQSAMVDRFASLTFTAPMEGYIQRMLWALEADGVVAAGARDPFAPRLASGEQARVAEAVRLLRAP